MWKSKTVAVVFPTYREKNSIRRVIREFDSSGFVDEIIVADNNAEPGTREEVAKTRARLVSEKRQGYGFAIRKGLSATNADLIIVAEPDGSFDGRDVVKLLSYSDDFEMVFGSRTHVPLIHRGSDMTFYKRIGDVMLAKLTYILFICYPLTDLGCTLRLTSKRAWKKIASDCLATDNVFATEWEVVAAKNRIRLIEIPINFRARVGESMATDTLFKQLHWGWRKFLCILRIWLRS